MYLVRVCNSDDPCRRATTYFCHTSEKVGHGWSLQMKYQGLLLITLRLIFLWLDQTEFWFKLRSGTMLCKITTELVEVQVEFNHVLSLLSHTENGKWLGMPKDSSGISLVPNQTRLFWDMPEVIHIACLHSIVVAVWRTWTRPHTIHCLSAYTKILTISSMLLPMGVGFL